MAFNNYDHDRTGASQPAEGSAPEFVVTIKLAVDDISTLWLAAASRLLQADATTLEDVIDVIGPEEDPSIAECVTALTVPTFVAGCTLAEFEIAHTDAERRQTDTVKIEKKSQGVVVDMLQLGSMLKRSKAPVPKLSELVAASDRTQRDRPHRL